MLIELSKNKIEKILKAHELWSESNGEIGQRAGLRGADLRDANLRGADLSCANLSDADLEGANLEGANLKRADLKRADLSCANLRGADLRDANLRGADLRDANLRGADLRGADLKRADLRGADLRDANLRDANLRDANLRGADLEGSNLSDADLRDANLKRADLSYANLRGADLRGADYGVIQCPEEGSFIGFKKCREDKLVKLLILEDAKRSSATSRKCRASKAKVLEISNIDKTENYDEALSQHDSQFVYRVGEIIEIDDFNTDRWIECTTGIHFFITRQEAVSY